MFRVILFLNLESKGAGVAGELTTCKSQRVRLRGAIVEGTAREGVSQTSLSPAPGHMPQRGDRPFSRLKHVDGRPSRAVQAAEG